MIADTPAQRYVEKPRELDLIQWTGQNRSDVLAYLQTRGFMFTHQVGLFVSADDALVIAPTGSRPHLPIPAGSYFHWDGHGATGAPIVVDITRWESIAPE